MSSHTVFGSLNQYTKGAVKVIGAGENPKHYVFSNVFEVASTAKPYEKIAVAQNLKYVIEVLRAEGTSPWFAADHDEAALVMDGQVEVYLIKPVERQVPAGTEGAVRLAGAPLGEEMGWVGAGRGHMVLLPKGAAYQFRAKTTGVILLQTIKGSETVEKWLDICQTAA
jgi:hypothetical protein